VNFKRFRILLNISWCVIGIFLIIGFILSAIFAPAAIASYEFCDVYKKVFNTSVSLT